MDKETLKIIIETHNDVKHIVKKIDEHIVLDENRFKKINEDNDFLKKIVYGGIGILIFVEFIIKAIKP